MNFENSWEVDEYIEEVKRCTNSNEFLHWQLIEFTRLFSRGLDRRIGQRVGRVIKALSDKMADNDFRYRELTTI